MDWAIANLEISVMKCAFGCLSCTGPTENDCLEWNCPIGYYKENKTNGTFCYHCFFNCQTCTNENLCDSCPNQFTLQSGICTHISK